MSIAIAHGIDDHSTGSRVTTASMYPLGSVTKTYTAVLALQLAEANLIDLDKPIREYVDPILTKLNGTTLRKLFPHDPRVLETTTRQFLAMRSGMPDYNATANREWAIVRALLQLAMLAPLFMSMFFLQYNLLNRTLVVMYYAYLRFTFAPIQTHPDGVFTPLDYVNTVKKTLVCDPGTCGEYSSTGFDFVGFALAQASCPWIHLCTYAILSTSMRIGHQLFILASVEPICSIRPITGDPAQAHHLPYKRCVKRRDTSVGSVDGPDLSPETVSSIHKASARTTLTWCINMSV